MELIILMGLLTAATVIPFVIDSEDQDNDDTPDPETEPSVTMSVDGGQTFSNIEPVGEFYGRDEYSGTSGDDIIKVNGKTDAHILGGSGFDTFITDGESDINLWDRFPNEIIPDFNDQPNAEGGDLGVIYIDNPDDLTIDSEKSSIAYNANDILFLDINEALEEDEVLFMVPRFSVGPGSEGSCCSANYFGVVDFFVYEDVPDDPNLLDASSVLNDVYYSDDRYNISPYGDDIFESEEYLISPIASFQVFNTTFVFDDYEDNEAYEFATWNFVQDSFRDLDIDIYTNVETRVHNLFSDHGYIELERPQYYEGGYANFMNDTLPILRQV